MQKRREFLRASGEGGEGATEVLPTEAGLAAAEAPTEVVEPAPPAPGPGPSRAAEGDRLEQLERLGRLRDAGILTDEEFAEEKARIREAGE